ncbi:MAG: HlyD family type I secretion periplasmic adaptor subunit, partial [Cellvibrionaceae bacterium]|nr:HlyD family type I secretion periplasmic adaptor subunit [Cellvibrionaceae bacterium]
MSSNKTMDDGTQSKPEEQGDGASGAQNLKVSASSVRVKMPRQEPPPSAQNPLQVTVSTAETVRPEASSEAAAKGQMDKEEFERAYQMAQLKAQQQAAQQQPDAAEPVAALATQPATQPTQEPSEAGQAQADAPQAAEQVEAHSAGHSAENSAENSAGHSAGHSAEPPAPKKKRWFDGDTELIQEDLDYMSSAAAAVLQQSPRGGQQLLWAICIFFVVAVVWASLAYVDEFTRGEGKVIPSSHVQVVQNLEGGIVAEIYVREGQIVEAGQELLRIDDTQFSSSLREADVTLEQLKAKATRLEMEAEGKAFPSKAIDGVGEVAWAQEAALFSSRRSEQESNSQVLKQQVAQRRQELNELRARRDQHRRSHKLLDQELQMSRPLVASGAMSQVELLRIERQVNDLYGELKGAELAIPRAESSLQEARDKLSSSKLAFRSEARKELADVRLELQRLSESSGALQDRVKRTMITSPVAGTIKQVLVTTIGGVIQPGMNIIEIVPTEDSLLIEAKIRPADIAFLHPGQEAIIKFTAYDFSIHGGLKGEVVHISPDTIMDEEGMSFYTVRVETE